MKMKHYLLLAALLVSTPLAFSGCASDTSSTDDSNTDLPPYTKQLVITQQSVELTAGESTEVDSKLSCGCGFNLHMINIGDTSKCQASFDAEFTSDHKIKITAKNGLPMGMYQSKIVFGAKDKAKSHIQPDTVDVTVHMH